MATLITGAGLIGSQVARLLVERGEPAWLYDVRPNRDALATVVDPERIGIIEGDIEDAAALDRVLREHRIERIVHTAALLTAGILPDIARGVRTNVVGTVTVLEAARRAGVGRVVLTSSSTLYYGLCNEPASGPYPGDFAMRVISQRPGSLYAATKLAVEHLGLLYADQFGLDVVVTRPAGVLGLWPGSTGGFSGRLVRALLEPAMRGEVTVIDDPLLVWKGGDEFVDARDAASGLVAALFAQRPAGRVYSVGMGVLHSFEDFVHAARQAVPGLRVEVRVQPKGGFSGFRFVRDQPSDISAAKRELGWTPQYDLSDTMKSCAAFIAGRGGMRRGTK
jgi:UDP-glucose 4-epimerase